MSDHLTDLKAKLAAREGKKEYADSVKAIKLEIARLETPSPISTSTAPVRGAE